MPSKPRTPITYAPTGGEMFRPKSQVEAERTALEQSEHDALEQGTVEPVSTEPGDGALTAQDEEPNERINERTNVYKERRVIRHSFDIYHDQLMQLGEIQMRLYREAGKKPKLGQLVQDALDRYIEAHDTGVVGASADDAAEPR